MIIAISSSETPPVAPNVLAMHSIVQYRLGRLDKQIGTEFDLVGHRMTWLMVSQSFLLSAFATCITAVKGEHWATLALQFLLPTIGIVSAALVAVAIGAAHRQIERLKNIRRDLETFAVNKLEYEKLGVDTDTRDHNSGNAPSRFLPSGMVVVWSIILSATLLYWLFAKK